MFKNIVVRFRLHLLCARVKIRDSNQDDAKNLSNAEEPQNWRPTFFFQREGMDAPKWWRELTRKSFLIDIVSLVLLNFEGFMSLLFNKFQGFSLSYSKNKTQGFNNIIIPLKRKYEVEHLN